MRPTAVSDEEAKWRRRSDARTLAEAERIKEDQDRYNQAIQGAKEIAQEEIDQAKSIIKVAGLKTPKVPKSSSNAEPTAQRGFQQAVPNTVQTPQFAPRRSNPATIGRL